MLGARREGEGQKFPAALEILPGDDSFLDESRFFAGGAQGHRQGVLSKETMHAQGTKLLVRNESKCELLRPPSGPLLARSAPSLHSNALPLKPLLVAGMSKMSTSSVAATLGLAAAAGLVVMAMRKSQKVPSLPSCDSICCE